MAVILVFSVLYMVVAAVFAVRGGNFEFIVYIVVMALIVFGVLALHRRVGLSVGVFWCLSVWGLLHMAGGFVPIPSGWQKEGTSAVLYNLEFLPGSLKYDQVVHAFGFGVTTWLCWQALSARVLDEEGNPLRPTFGIMLLCAAAGIGFGALNEVVEFFATLVLPETNVGGYVNTGWDLVANLVGAVAAAVILYFTYKDTNDSSGGS